jgi:hypothetical protein
MTSRPGDVLGPVGCSRQRAWAAFEARKAAVGETGGFGVVTEEALVGGRKEPGVVAAGEVMSPEGVVGSRPEPLMHCLRRLKGS